MCMYFWEELIMKYDFTSIMDRRGKDAIAVDMVGMPGGFAPAAPKEGYDVIPAPSVLLPKAPQRASM